jgi:hypothetical protein
MTSNTGNKGNVNEAGRTHSRKEEKPGQVPAGTDTVYHADDPQATATQISQIVGDAWNVMQEAGIEVKVIADCQTSAFPMIVTFSNGASLLIVRLNDDPGKISKLVSAYISQDAQITEDAQLPEKIDNAWILSNAGPIKIVRK